MIGGQYLWRLPQFLGNSRPKLGTQSITSMIRYFVNEVLVALEPWRLPQTQLVYIFAQFRGFMPRKKHVNGRQNIPNP